MFYHEVKLKGRSVFYLLKYMHSRVEKLLDYGKYCNIVDIGKGLF